MSCRRLAKRSIIGTKVCAPGPDGLWYSGVIQDVKTTPNTNLTTTTMDNMDMPSSDTKYVVRFDFKTQNLVENTTYMDARRMASINISPLQTLRRNAMIKEFLEKDLIGPGFRSIAGVQLQEGQRVYLTYSGRETSGDVIHHDLQKDEVSIKIAAIGIEEPIEVKKRLEELRLLESRRSARLADQDRDTDFARLADMGGDRRKASNSIDVPYTMTPSTNSRKRPTPTTFETFGEDCTEMNECNAALILMKLHNSPKSPTTGDKWLASSPGSSSASWSSGSSSPPLSDDGLVTHSLLVSNDPSARIRTTSVSTSDEGIVVDFTEEVPRKKKVSRFLCTWKGCAFVENNIENITSHIRNVHLRKKSPRRNDNEEEFYFTEEEDEDLETVQTSSTSPPTLSHRDMARPPHEDPEYQRQIVGNFKQCRNSHQISNTKSINYPHLQASKQTQNNIINSPTSPIMNNSLTSPSSTKPITSTPIHQQNSHNQVNCIKHIRASPRSVQSTAPYPSPSYVHQQHHNYSCSSNSCNSSSNNSSSILHGNATASNVLQQLSQQNVTVTTHPSAVYTEKITPQFKDSNEQKQVSTVTITPNFNPSRLEQSFRCFPPNNRLANCAALPTQVSQTQTHTHNVPVQQMTNSITKAAPNSPNRRTRGENKKCRKVYGMDRREQWCTQCKWKKACTRFGD